MKRYYKAILTTVILSLSSCVRPDMSDCGMDDNCVLLFQINAMNTGSDAITDKLNSIDAFLFDANGRYVTQERVSESELNEFPGIRLTVPPGEYHVVCWGNVSEKSIFSDMRGAMFGESHLTTASSETGSKLYYAPEVATTKADSGDRIRVGEDMEVYKIVIPANAVVEKELAFIRAHRTLNIYIDNYYAEESAPIAELSGMPSTVDFFLNAAPDRKAYKQRAHSYTSPEGEMHRAVFDAHITDIDENVFLNIYNNSDGSAAMSPLSIKQYVEQNSDQIEDLNEIDILVRFNMDATVTITMPSWNNISVEPLRD